jgi:putative FmdB family regulatory protein
MPIYEYECSVCHKDLEVMQKITEGPLTECPDCGGALRKKMSSTSFVLKGTGWYATDYASDKRKPQGAAPKDKKAAASTPEKKEDTKAAKEAGTKETAVSG